VPRRFGYDPRPHRGDHFLRRPGVTAGGAHTHVFPIVVHVPLGQMVSWKGL
jgi:hypothetical protein